jgi:arginine repressor
MYFDEILGTLAGDDTIFVGTPDNPSAKALRSKLLTLSKTDTAEEHAEED